MYWREKIDLGLPSLFAPKMQALEENLGQIQRELYDLLDCSYNVEFLIEKLEDDYNDWLDGLDVRRAIYEEQMYLNQLRINDELLAANQTLMCYITANRAYVQSMQYLIYSLRN